MTDQITKILIVDDEASLGRLLKAGLEMHGFTVRFETRSTDAIKTCLEFDPDLVLLDVDMPVKDGGMVAAEMKGHPALGRTPVIFLTSLVRKEETAKPNASGEIFLSKPIPIPELVARIRIVLHYRLPPEPLVPCFPRNPVRLSSFGAFHGAGRSRAQFAMGFVGIAMESQSVDVRGGDFDPGNLIAGEIRREAALPEVVLPLDFAFGLGSRSIQEADVVNVEPLLGTLALLFHGLDAELEFPGDLLVGLAFGNQLRHFRRAGAEGVSILLHETRIRSNA